MKPRKLQAPALSAIRDPAGECLSRSGNRFLLIEASILLLMNAAFYYLLSSLFSVLQAVFLQSGNHGGIVAAWLICGLLIALCVLFFTLPMLIGLFFLAGQIAKRETPVLSDLFAAFSTGRYRLSLALSFSFFWRAGLIFAAVFATCHTVRFFFAGSLLFGFLCGLLVLVEPVLGLLWLLRRFSLLFFVLDKGMTLEEAMRSARRTYAACRFFGAGFWLWFLPRILLGLVTFGIFLIWEVLPRMCVSYFLYCKQMNEMMNQSEDLKI